MILCTERWAIAPDGDSDDLGSEVGEVGTFTGSITGVESLGIAGKAGGRLGRCAELGLVRFWILAGVVPNSVDSLFSPELGGRIGGGAEMLLGEVEA
jgi:hypothetical protein